MDKNIFKLWSRDMLSVDIGSHTIKIIIGRYENNNVIIKKAIRIPTPKDAYSDGEILDILSLKEAISGALNTNKFKVTKAICSLESSTIITREINMPSVGKEQMKKMLEFEIQQYLPIEVDQYIIQYKLLEDFYEEGVKKTKVLATALPKKIAEGYLHLIEAIGLKPMVLDIHSNVINKLLKTDMIKSNRVNLQNDTIAAIDLGHSQINVTLIENGIYKFNRLLKIGGKDIDMNLYHFLNSSLEEAEFKKAQIRDINEGTYDLTAAAFWGKEEIRSTALEKEINEIPDSSRFVNIVKSSIDNWVEEIEKVFKYYTTRSIDNTIDCIYLYGGSGELGGIDRYMEEVFNIPTIRIKSIGNIKLDKNAEEMNISSYINNIGIFIRK